ncbi:hypothetical protein [Staphylococcus gallinarum]|uniref:hypothetical protein n=1 Tax=Staphylococcus gallinarum TaxID=1293 RepID=UPI000D1F147D|nr:hypothetical protein [Staphylococcus gallinarum]MBU7218578.1 hypothetical protein [Staphylococcus gallinarum]MCD8794313.1 hypothetical protein [Staphylococcus gallinarum]MCD8918092.1 hypothetical protein [Staphylococcus gallinarum]PTK88441.1 hypothetical protein BUZ03_13355 [Staphylococcus gallinarum]
MLNSLLSISASALTIISFFIPIIRKSKSSPRTTNNQENIGSNNNNVNYQNIHTENHNYQNIHTENHKHQNVQEIVKKECTIEDDSYKFILLGLGILFALTIFIKFNFIVIGVSCTLVFLIGILTIYRLKKYQLPIRSYFYYSAKYSSFTLILLSSLFLNPKVISNLENKFDKIYFSSFSTFFESIIEMIKTTIIYFHQLNFPSVVSFVLILRFFAIIFIYAILFNDVRKNAILNTINSLYKNKKSHILSYITLLALVIVLIFFTHFYYFQNFIMENLNPIIHWLQN